MRVKKTLKIANKCKIKNFKNCQNAKKCQKMPSQKYIYF